MHPAVHPQHRGKPGIQNRQGVHGHTTLNAPGLVRISKEKAAGTETGGWRSLGHPAASRSPAGGLAHCDGTRAIKTTLILKLIKNYKIMINTALRSGRSTTTYTNC